MQRKTKAKTTPEAKPPAKPKDQKTFGVYKYAIGSYATADHTFKPGDVVQVIGPIPKDAPVRIFTIRQSAARFARETMKKGDGSKRLI